MTPPAELARFLLAHNLATEGESANWRPLTGGVSSDIWLVELPGRALCLKRALAKLKVAADWEAPLSRNAHEWAWVKFAARHCPDNIPAPIAHDAESGIFAMAFLPPEEHSGWKALLLGGHVEIETARAVGSLIGRIHAASAKEPGLADQFDTIANFRALRLDPYLIATANKYPTHAEVLEVLVKRTAAQRRVLVHGDVSPKNILVRPCGPVLLDAECAWFGDPAFDVAFCLNHLLLKCLVRPAERSKLFASFRALTEAYFSNADWEPRAALEERAATLLPALMLARVDGKSPVEYLDDESDRDTVRRVACSLLAGPVRTLSEAADRHAAALQSCEG